MERIIGRMAEKGLTVVPTRIYFKDGRAKVEIALARGKDRFDKRQSIKEREMKRDLDRAMSER
jgi:SsrA-binding protein